MVSIVELAWKLMDPGGHGHIFCSALHLPQWVTVIGKGTVEVVVDNRRRGDPIMNADKVINNAQKPLECLKTPHVLC